MATMSSHSLFKEILNPLNVQELVRAWLKEDSPNFDIAGCVLGADDSTAVLLGKSSGILAGAPFFDAVFKELSCVVDWIMDDGDPIHPVAQVARVSGKPKDILLGERVALNCISRASGVATAARRIVERVREEMWEGEIAGTRKTTPGFRMVEKYALIVGGAMPHRYDLSSMIMLKDNHIWACGSIEKAVKECRQKAGSSYKIEVECQNLDETCEAAGAGADIVMLDNMGGTELHSVADKLKKLFPHLKIEASGGIDEGNIRKYLSPNVDVISLGCLTHGYPVLDFSLKIYPAE